MGRISKKWIALFTFLGSIFVTFATYGQEVTLPPLNLGGTSFLDGVASPGLLLEETIEYYHGNPKEEKSLVIIL